MTLYDAPPHSIEAEEAFIGAALSDPNVVEWALGIDLAPADFYRLDHQHVWRAMTGLYEARQPIDIVTVGEALLTNDTVDAPLSLLANIARSAGHVWNAQHYGTLIKEKALRRDLLQAAANISAMAYTEGDEIGVILDKAEDVIRRTRRKTPDAGRNPDPADIIARLEGDKVAGTPTRWPALNNVSGGGMTRGHIWIIGGFSSTGKSATLVNLVEDIVNANHAAMVASTEMTSEGYLLRLLSLTSGVPQWNVRTMDMTLDQHAAYIRAKTFWQSARIRVFDDLYTVARIRRQAKRMQEQVGLDALFVDFLGNLSETGDEVKDARSSIIQLQQLAKELNIAVIVLSQLSNQMAQSMAESGLGNFYSLKGSGAVRDAGDLVVILDRDRVNAPEVMKLSVVKNRHGATTNFRAWFDLTTGRLTQMTPEEEMENDPNAGRRSKRVKEAK